MKPAGAGGACRTGSSATGTGLTGGGSAGAALTLHEDAGLIGMPEGTDTGTLPTNSAGAAPPPAGAAPQQQVEVSRLVDPSGVAP